jgi:hypothetical protein
VVFTSSATSKVLMQLASAEPLLTVDSTNLSTFLGANAGNTTVTGYADVGVGYTALQGLTLGHGNTGVGQGAGKGLTSGNNNSAFGAVALYRGTTGSGNSALGAYALENNQSGHDNVAVGYNGLDQNDAGFDNTAVGSQALYQCQNGSSNVAIGYAAGAALTNGSNNIVIGANAGTSLVDGSNNIYIGNAGVASETETTRIGDGNTVACHIGGISGVTSASGVPVLINTNNKLGTTTSSRRFKHDIRDMGESSGLVMSLRPVTFKYNAELDPEQIQQYGLVAEEVANVSKDLVQFNADGKPNAVRYQLINAMLLNEVQKQRKKLDVQQQQLETQAKLIQNLTSRLDTMDASRRGH